MIDTPFLTTHNNSCYICLHIYNLNKHKDLQDYFKHTTFLEHEYAYAIHKNINDYVFLYKELTKSEFLLLSKYYKVIRIYGD